MWSTAWREIQCQAMKPSTQPLLVNAFAWTTLIPSIVFSAIKKKLFFHAKRVSSEFGELIIHTPDKDVNVLALGFSRFLDCQLTQQDWKTRTNNLNIQTVNKLKASFNFPEKGFPAYSGCETSYQCFLEERKFYIEKSWFRCDILRP